MIFQILSKIRYKDYIIVIIYKNNQEIKILSKINCDSLKINNKKFIKLNLYNDEDFFKILQNLKIIYEDEWKKNNEINTSIKLPLTISVNSKDYEKILKLENALNNFDLISEFYILKFDSQSIQYKIIYNGSPKTFLNDMSDKDFEFVTENNIWRIK